MTRSLHVEEPRLLRRGMAALAALMMVPVFPVQASVIPSDEKDVRELISQVASTGDLNKMSELMAAGLDINLLDSDGQPALVTAILSGQDDMALLLLAHNADVYARTTKGMTALHAAAYVGDVALARRLIAEGADVNDQQNIAGITPLHAAAEEDHLAVARALVRAGADPEKVEVNGYTAGSRAGWREHWQVVRFLLQSGDTCQPESLAGAWLYDKCTHLDLSASN